MTKKVKLSDVARDLQIPTQELIGFYQERDEKGNTKKGVTGLTPEEIKASGFDKYYIDHTLAIWPQAASGEPFSASQFQSTGDTITDLYENMAAEQKARLTYDNILRIIKDPEIADPIRFLRMREIVHFQRFGECLRRIQDQRNPKNFYAYNPQIDKKKC